MNNPKKILVVLLLLLPISLLGQTLQAYRNTVEGGYNFWVSTPEDYQKTSEKKPIILFLHGASLCGHNLDRVRRYGPLHALAMGREIDAVIVAPQNPGGAWKPKRIDRVIDWVYQHYDVDTNRLYVIGMSLGGYGTIDYSAAYSHRIAAAMALCGGGNPKSYCGLNDMPLWIVHGTADRAVPISQSQKVINGMRQCGESPRLRFTKLHGVDHGGLARAFYISETYDWLFTHRLDSMDRPVNTDYDITVARLKSAYKDIDRKANHLTVINATPGEDNPTISDSTDLEQTSATKGKGHKYHTIKSGDTLGHLARKYHTTVRKLCRMNNIKETTTLRIGRRLRVR